MVSIVVMYKEYDQNFYLAASRVAQQNAWSCALKFSHQITALWLFFISSLSDNELQLTVSCYTECTAAQFKAT